MTGRPRRSGVGPNGLRFSAETRENLLRQVRSGNRLRSGLEVFVMPRGASPKRERQYKKIEQELEKEGRYKGREEEVAARIVNKQRAKSGETKTAKKKSSRKKSSKR